MAFRTGSSLEVVPYVRFALQPGTLVSVTVGPCLHPDVRRCGVEKLLVVCLVIG